MPISIDEYRTPRFVRPKEKQPFSEDPKAKFLNYEDYPRHYRGESGFPQQGYNSKLNQATPKVININVDDLTLPHY